MLHLYIHTVCVCYIGERQLRSLRLGARKHDARTLHVCVHCIQIMSGVLLYSRQTGGSETRCTHIACLCALHPDHVGGVFIQRTNRCICFWLVGEARRKEMFYLTTHSTHFIYGYMASDTW